MKSDYTTEEETFEDELIFDELFILEEELFMFEEEFVLLCLC